MMNGYKAKLFPKLEKFVKTLDTTKLSPERREVLIPLIAYLQEKQSMRKAVNLNFICTHNSRRSHLSQIWAQTLANYLGIPNITCYSGGTEATALFPMVVSTLDNTGFKIKQLSETENPVYSIKYYENQHPIIGFSKTYDDAFNPTSGFAAIMTCNSANEACPNVIGAEKRFPITYEDPKTFDNTPLQTKKYQERSLQIATELLFVFESLAQNS